MNHSWSFVNIRVASQTSPEGTTEDDGEHQSSSVVPSGLYAAPTMMRRGTAAPPAPVREGCWPGMVRRELRVGASAGMRTQEQCVVKIFSEKTGL